MPYGRYSKFCRMIRSNDGSCCSNSSRVGNGISDISSLVAFGMSSCVRRMKKLIEIDVRVRLQHLAQRADIPRRRAGDLQHADLVADHAHDEAARVVGRDGLALQRPARDLVDVAADARRRHLERDGDVVIAGGQVDELLAQRLTVGRQRDRDLHRGQAGRVDHGLDPHDRPHERELVGHDLRDREIFETVARGPHGVHARVERAQEVAHRAVAGVLVEAAGRRTVGDQRRCRRGRDLRSGRARARAPCGSSSSCLRRDRRRVRRAWSRRACRRTCSSRSCGRCPHFASVSGRRGDQPPRALDARRALRALGERHRLRVVDRARRSRLGSRATCRSSTAGSRNTTSAPSAAAPRKPIRNVRRHAARAAACPPRRARRSRRPRAPPRIEPEPAPWRQEHPAVLVEVGGAAARRAAR